MWKEQNKKLDLVQKTIMKRKVENKLIAWKEKSKGKTALLVDGARRVGKSYIAEEFARNNYKSYILIDFNKAGNDIKELFDKNLNEDTTLIVAASDLPSKGFATLRWAGNDGHDRVFDMHAMYIEISGKADKRSSSNICHIDSDAVSTQHVQIKYEQATQTFSLAAYGKVRLNSREVPVSVGGNPQWVPLAKSHSTIFINDSVSVEFNANSDLV